MKTFTRFLTCLLLLTAGTFAQVSVSTDGSAADPSSMLDVKSNAKGILYPRLTTTERDAISSPANSLMIFNTTTMCLEIYNSFTSAWETVHCLVCPSPASADTITGPGIVCTGQGGVPYSVTAIPWATGYMWTYSGTGFSIISGSNTNSIIADLNSATSGSLTVYGTNICGNGAVSPGKAITISSVPATPAAGTHIPSQTQIVWNWNPVSGATGYKWNVSNDYGSATDMGTSTSKTETGLVCNAAYTRYIWAYNKCGVSASTTLLQGTSDCPCGQPFTDFRDGQTYSTFPYGSQCWMTKNLNVGTRIDGSGDQANNSTIEKYCYNDLESNCNTYGGLYQWNEAMQYSTTLGVQGICPSGWHFPTDAEWSVLTNYFNGQSELRCNGQSWYIGKAMASKTFWNYSGSTCAIGNNSYSNNMTFFSGLPAGARSPSSFNQLGYFSLWWSSTENDNDKAWYHYLHWDYAPVFHSFDSKFLGFSVRCLRDN